MHHNVFAATPSGATFLPPSLNAVRGYAVKEEDHEETEEEQEEQESNLAGTEISLMEEEQAEDVPDSLVVSLNIPVTTFQFCPGCGASTPDIEVKTTQIISDITRPGSLVVKSL